MNAPSDNTRECSQSSEPMHPVWTHDCDSCQYIGTVMMPDAAYDWYVHRYVHDNARARDTYIARYGHEGSHYTTLVSDDPRAVFTHVGSGLKSYSGHGLIAYALRSLGLVPRQGKDL